MKFLVFLAGLAAGAGNPCEDLAEPVLAVLSGAGAVETAECEWNLLDAGRIALASQWHGNKEFLLQMDPVSAFRAARLMQSVLRNYPPTFVQIYQVADTGRAFRYRILPYRRAPGDPGVLEFLAALDNRIGFQKETPNGRRGILSFAGSDEIPQCFADQVAQALAYESHLSDAQRETLSVLPQGARTLVTNWINSAAMVDATAEIAIEGAYPDRADPYIYYEVTAGDVEAINELAKKTIGLRVDQVDDRVWRLTVPGSVAGSD